MTKKTDFIAASQEAITVIGKLGPKFAYLAKTYSDRGYGSGGSDPIIAGDIPTELGITPANIASFITFAEQIGKFLGNLSVTTGDYQATVNTLRTDI